MSMMSANDEELEKLSKELSPLLDRIHTDYNKFFTGAEKLPPVQLLGQLEKLTTRVRSLQRQCRNNGVLFRAQNAMAKYSTYKAMWDKKLMTRERG